MTRRDSEDALLAALLLAGPPLDTVQPQFAYVPGRRFRADFAWPEYRLLVEVQGGIYTGQAHGSISGVLADIERGNLATLGGWRVLRFPTARDQDTWVAECLATIEQALKGER